MYILALNGSHNNDGNTAFLLNEILRHCAEKGAETEICSVSEAIMDTKTPFCVACSTPCTKKCYKDTKLDTLFDKIERADFVVFAKLSENKFLPLSKTGVSGEFRYFGIL